MLRSFYYYLCSRRNRRSNKSIATYYRAVADNRLPTENTCSGINSDIVPYCGMALYSGKALTFSCRKCAYRNSLIYLNSVSYNSSFSYYNSRTVIYKEILSYRCTGVYIGTFSRYRICASLYTKIANIPG